MALSSTTTRVQYSGNGVTTAFSFPYKFFANGDLTVILRTSAGVETTQTITTHYTVTGAGLDAGGTVTMVTAPATGQSLIIIREPDFVQELDLVENDPLPAEELEKAYDKLVMLVQYLHTKILRAVRFTDGETSSASLALPSPEANKVLGWNTGATGLQNLSAADLATVSASGNWKVDTFSGDGSTVAFTLTTNPGSINNTQVYISGVYQAKSSYSLASATLTFGAAPAVGTNNIQVVYSSIVDQGTPSDLSVSTGKLADNAVTTAKIADSQVTSAKLASTLISGLTAETAIALDDLLPISDTSEGALNKMTPENFLKVLNLLTEDASPDTANDFLLSYDASASTVKKVKPTNIAAVPAGSVVQVVNLLYATTTSTAASNMPLDDTIPQITEGGEMFTQSFTPTNASNKLFIDVLINASDGGTGNKMRAALFQDATANALAAVMGVNQYGANFPNQLSLKHYMTAGTTSAITFRIRMGGAGDTITLNAISGTRVFGGVQNCVMTIMEIKV